MRKSPGKPKSRTKSPPSRSTKRSKGSTPTSRPGSRFQSLATELYSRSLKPKQSLHLEEAVVEGISMWPNLRAGYRVKFRAVDPEALEPGDIIVIQAQGRKGEPRLKVHRFLGRVGELFLEAGDNAFSAALVDGREILGRVESVVGWNGKKIALPAYRETRARFRFFRGCASAFVFTHELKDRLVGQKRSKLLWQASLAYRASLGALGLKVPVIAPK